MKRINSVLDLIQKRKYDKARYEYIEMMEPKCKAMVSKKTRDTNENGPEVIEKWDCTGGIMSQINQVPLFQFDFCDDYDSCSNSDAECEYFDDYTKGSGSHSTRVQKQQYLGVFTDLMHDMQKQFFDIYYNNYGEEVICGAGTRAKQNEDGYHDRKCMAFFFCTATTFTSHETHQAQLNCDSLTLYSSNFLSLNVRKFFTSYLGKLSHSSSIKLFYFMSFHFSSLFLGTFSSVQFNPPPAL